MKSANTLADNIMRKKVGFARHQEDDEQEEENLNITDKLGANSPILAAFDDVIVNNYYPCDNVLQADEMISSQDLFNKFQAYNTEKLITIPILVQLLKEHNYSSRTFGSAQLWLFQNKS